MGAGNSHLPSEGKNKSEKDESPEKTPSSENDTDTDTDNEPEPKHKHKPKPENETSKDKKGKGSNGKTPEDKTGLYDKFAAKTYNGKSTFSFKKEETKDYFELNGIKRLIPSTNLSDNKSLFGKRPKENEHSYKRLLEYSLMTSWWPFVTKENDDIPVFDDTSNRDDFYDFFGKRFDKGTLQRADFVKYTFLLEKFNFDLVELKENLIKKASFGEDNPMKMIYEEAQREMNSSDKPDCTLVYGSQAFNSAFAAVYRLEKKSNPSPIFLPTTLSRKYSPNIAYDSISKWLEEPMNFGHVSTIIFAFPAALKRFVGDEEAMQRLFGLDYKKKSEYFSDEESYKEFVNEYADYFIKIVKMLNKNGYQFRDVQIINADVTSETHSAIVKRIRDAISGLDFEISVSNSLWGYVTEDLENKYDYYPGLRAESYERGAIVRKILFSSSPKLTIDTNKFLEEFAIDDFGEPESVILDIQSEKDDHDKKALLGALIKMNPMSFARAAMDYLDDHDFKIAFKDAPAEYYLASLIMKGHCVDFYSEVYFRKGKDGSLKKSMALFMPDKKDASADKYLDFESSPNKIDCAGFDEIKEMGTKSPEDISGYYSNLFCKMLLGISDVLARDENFVYSLMNAYEVKLDANLLEKETTSVSGEESARLNASTTKFEMADIIAASDSNPVADENEVIKTSAEKVETANHKPVTWTDLMRDKIQGLDMYNIVVACPPTKRMAQAFGNPRNYAVALPENQIGVIGIHSSFVINKIEKRVTRSKSSTEVEGLYKDFAEDLISNSKKGALDGAHFTVIFLDSSEFKAFRTDFNAELNKQRSEDRDYDEEFITLYAVFGDGSHSTVKSVFGNKDKKSSTEYDDGSSIVKCESNYFENGFMEFAWVDNRVDGQDFGLKDESAGVWIDRYLGPVITKSKKKSEASNKEHEQVMVAPIGDFFHVINDILESLRKGSDNDNYDFYAISAYEQTLDDEAKTLIKEEENKKEKEKAISKKKIKTSVKTAEPENAKSFKLKKTSSILEEKLKTKFAEQTEFSGKTESVEEKEFNDLLATKKVDHFEFLIPNSYEPAQLTIPGTNIPTTTSFYNSRSMRGVLKFLCEQSAEALDKSKQFNPIVTISTYEMASKAISKTLSEIGGDVKKNILVLMFISKYDKKISKEYKSVDDLEDVYLVDSDDLGGHVFLFSPKDMKEKTSSLDWVYSEGTNFFSAKTQDSKNDDVRQPSNFALSNRLQAIIGKYEPEPIQSNF